MSAPHLLPSILQADNGNSISVERAIKHARRMLLELVPSEIANSEEHNSAWYAALSDLDFLLTRIVK